MYQALYRKYRPNNFNEVVGQEVIVKTLKNAISNNSLTHAYLFTGPRGTGKTSVAKILAKTINCENHNNGLPCNSCVSCTQINQKNFIDIIEIDAASNNGVDEIRELKNKINLVPSLGKYKIYIIDEVHMLTTGAFNALLKTLEEPPQHVIFVLATTDPQKIPATILSRCQRFDFKRISETFISGRIKEICDIENINIDESGINEIARLSDGGMRDALSILDQVVAFSDDKITLEDIHMINGTLTQEQLSKFVQYIINNDLYNNLNLIEKWDNEGKNLSKILEEIILFFKNILISKEAPSYLEEKKLDLNLYNSFNELVEESKIIEYIDVFNKNLYEIKKSNKPKMIFDLLIIKILNKSEIKQQSIASEKTVKPKEKTEEKKIEVSKKVEPKLQEETGVNKVIKEKLKQIKETRINNALAGFNKKELLNLKEKQDDLKPLLIDLDYSMYVSIILDGELKVASDTNLIYVFDTETNADLFNQNIIKIEETLEKVFAKKYSVIAIDNISWEIIKKEFNSKTKQYTYQEENININEIFKEESSSNEIENLFGNEIEYN